MTAADIPTIVTGDDYAEPATLKKGTAGNLVTFDASGSTIKAAVVSKDHATKYTSDVDQNSGATGADGRTLSWWSRSRLLRPPRSPSTDWPRWRSRWITERAKSPGSHPCGLFKGKSRSDGDRAMRPQFDIDALLVLVWLAILLGVAGGYL